MMVNAIVKKVPTKLHAYRIVQKERGSRLPYITSREWKRYADKNGVAVLVYYRDGSIQLASTL